MLNQLTTLSSGLSGCWEWSKRQYQSVDDVIIWGQVENGKMMMFQNTISISWWHYHNIKVENATKTISIRILGVWKLMMMLQKDNLNHYHLGCLVQKNLHCTVLGQTGHKTNPNNTRLFFPFWIKTNENLPECSSHFKSKSCWKWVCTNRFWPHGP